MLHVLFAVSTLHDLPGDQQNDLEILQSVVLTAAESVSTVTAVKSGIATVGPVKGW